MSSDGLSLPIIEVYLRLGMRRRLEQCRLDLSRSEVKDVLVGRDRAKVLVVEDDLVSALLVKKLLAGQGIASDHATDGKQAIEMHRLHPYRMVVSDWMMPEMSGIELCRALRGLDGNYLYFILCSAKGDRADRLEAFESGVDDFLGKPLDRDELHSRLKVARRILSSEDGLNQKKSELEKVGETLQEMNANLVMASRRFAELFNGLPAACFTFDEFGLVHEWNRAAESLFGIPSFKAFQQPVSDIFGNQAEVFWTEELVAKIVTEGGHPTVDWTYLAPSGSERHFACTVFALRNENGALIGAISANLDVTDRREAQKRVEEQIQQINEFASILEIQKRALEDANKQLALRADTDGLTGLLNHRRMQGDLEECFTVARSRNAPLSAILMDVDKFKDFNDSFGHQAGDDVLRKFASILRANSRESEAVARYGGEEFAVIMPGCTKEQAIAAAERFRKAIEAETWEHRKVTASFGVATFDESLKSPRDLLMRSDAALYYSKETGRNRVAHFSDLPEGYEPKVGPAFKRAA